MNPADLRKKVCVNISRIAAQARGQIKATVKKELRNMTNLFFTSLTGSINQLTEELTRAEAELKGASFIYEDHIRFCKQVEMQLLEMLQTVDELLNTLPKQSK